MPKAIQQLQTDDAPAAVGPYSQGIVAGDFAFLSGQIPIDPKTRQIITGGIEAQTHQVMQNIKAVVKAAGADMARVVKMTVFLTDMDDFSTVNGIYEQYFSGILPARSVIQVSALPMGANIEMEAVVSLK